jgi:hypothetical protein
LVLSDSKEIFGGGRDWRICPQCERGAGKGEGKVCALLYPLQNFSNFLIVMPKTPQFTHNGETENAKRPRRAARRARERRQGKEEECRR